MLNSQLAFHNICQILTIPNIPNTYACRIFVISSFFTIVYYSRVYSVLCAYKTKLKTIRLYNVYFNIIY